MTGSPGGKLRAYWELGKPRLSGLAVFAVVAGAYMAWPSRRVNPHPPFDLLVATTVGNNLAAIGAALRQVEGLQTFSTDLRDALREGLGNLVDADLAEESARLTSLQTKQQLAVQSLSIANQQPSRLLGLFPSIN